jgi:hypothetical protein
MIVPDKTLLILANSYKHKGRCIAGREIERRPAGYALGQWVRPVSRVGEGELHEMQAYYATDSPVAVMDVARLAVIAHARDAGQPENWYVSKNAHWRKLSVPALPSPDLAESPADLWIDAGAKQDRMSHAFLQDHPLLQSLWVIRPDSLELRFWTEKDGFDGRDRPRRQAAFKYNRRFYDWSLTDPVAIASHAAPFPPAGQLPIVVQFPAGKIPLLCVSLTPEFNGYHYKVVATIIHS